MVDMSKLVTGIDVDSAWLPPIHLKDPFKPGPPSPALQQLKPKITLRLKGLDPVIIAPYGKPGPTRWPWVRAGLVVGGVALLALAAGRLVR